MCTPPGERRGGLKMGTIDETIEAIARRVYRQEKEREQEAGPAERAAGILDDATQERINQYQLISHKPYLTRREAALYLDVSERSIAEWAARPPDRNPFPECRAGADARVKREHIDQWAEREGMRRKMKAAG